MSQTFVFQREKPAVFDIEKLQEEVRAIAPEVEVIFLEFETYENGWPWRPGEHPEYLEVPADKSAPYTKPNVLIFENVPEQYTKKQVRNFILNHAPGKNREDRIKEERANQIIDSLIQNASEEKRLELRGWLQG